MHSMQPAEIAVNFGNDPRTIELARLWLANAMLSIACEDSRDVEVLKQASLERMAQDTKPLHLSHLAGDLPTTIVRGSPDGGHRRSSSPPAESQVPMVDRIASCIWQVRQAADLVPSDKPLPPMRNASCHF
jgi:hypothetical protein